MVARIVPLLIALSVAGAPVAVEACQVMCAASDHVGMPRAAIGHASHDRSHSCHGDNGDAGPRLSQLPHTCGHDGEEPPTAPHISASRISTIATPLAVASGTCAALVRPARGLFVRPPIPVRLTVPTSVRSTILRI